MIQSSPMLRLVVHQLRLVLHQFLRFSRTIVTQEGGTRTTAGHRRRRHGAATISRRAARMIQSSPLLRLVVHQLRLVLHQFLRLSRTIVTQEGGTRTTAGQTGNKHGAARMSRRAARETKSTLVRAEIVWQSFNRFTPADRECRPPASNGFTA